jgi:hypothetical protein
MTAAPDGASLGPIDMAPSQGAPAGSACMSTCDCQAGLACLHQKCRMLQQPVYCCSSSTCPSGNVCVTTMGNLQRCGGAGDGGMPPNFCTAVPCANDPTRCMQVGCGACDSATGRCTQ